MVLRITALLLLTLFGCTPYSETVGGAAPVGTVWELQSINDQPFTALATLQFRSPDAVSGSGPCNTYSARQTAPLPWFALEEFVTTKRTCPDQAAEAQYFQTLQSMDFSEVSTGKMLLSNAANDVMLFTTQVAPQS